MLSFHNDEKIKKKYLARVRNHQKADEIVKGQYWENGKGCAVGCTVHSNQHSAYEDELGIPRILAMLEDGIFENIPNDLAQKWPERFLKAIKVGVDLSMVWPKFAVWMLTDKEFGVLQFARSDASKKSIQDVSDAYQSYIENSKIEINWRKLKSAAAAAAAAYAAYAYADADAAYAYADADADARTKWRIAQADKLIELLTEVRR